jgi:hypothetical protein
MICKANDRKDRKPFLDISFILFFSSQVNVQKQNQVREEKIGGTQSLKSTERD